MLTDEKGKEYQSPIKVKDEAASSQQSKLDTDIVKAFNPNDVSSLAEKDFKTTQ